MPSENYTLWLTGLPCSGKTTIITELLKNLSAARLEGDMVRQSLSKDLGFSKEDRAENLRRAATLAKMLNEFGVNVVAGFVSPYEDIRKKVKETIRESGRFILVYVKCSTDECMRRDVKGMFAKAKKGLIPNFTGYSDPYEEPENPDIVVDTEKETVSTSTNKIIDFLTKEGIITPKATLFIGRFSPFHKGHKYIFDSVINNGGNIVVAIRDTQLDEKNPYTAEQRAKMIETVYAGNPKVKVLIIPDIDKVCVGRDVGYELMAVPENVRVISATKIRKQGAYENIPEEIVDLIRQFDNGNKRLHDTSPSGRKVQL
jgi:adenylylsulfate kinase